MKFSWLGPREGVIVEWPLNGLFYDRRGVIITSQMVVIRFPSNDGHYFKCRNFVIFTIFHKLHLCGQLSCTVSTPVYSFIACFLLNPIK